MLWSLYTTEEEAFPLSSIKDIGSSTNDGKIVVQGEMLRTLHFRISYYASPEPKIQIMF